MTISHEVRELVTAAVMQAARRGDAPRVVNLAFKLEQASRGYEPDEILQAYAINSAKMGHRLVVDGLMLNGGGVE